MPASVVSIPEDHATIELQEIWRVGEGEEIAEVASISANAAGYTAVVDFALAQVSVISPRGEWLGAWGGSGRGPGELTMPVTANWSGDTLIVFDIEQSRITRYVNSSSVTDSRVPAEFVAPVAMSGSIDYVAITSDDAVILQQPLARSQSADSSVLTILAQRPGLAGPDTVTTTRVRHIEWAGGTLPQPGAAVPLVAVGPDGWMATTAADGSYQVLVSGRNVTRQLCSPVPPLPMTDLERGAGSIPEGFEDAFAAIAEAPPPAVLNAIGRIVVSSTGDVWVDRRRPGPFTREKMSGAPGGTMDIFSATGDYVGRAHVPQGVSIQAVSDSIAVGVEFSDLDEASVIGYRLIR